MMMQKLTFAFAGLIALAAMPDASGQDRVRSSAGLALESIFNPQRAPEHKTMGLLQRSFLDMVEVSQRDLQVALVIDGTDSMAADIEGVQKSLQSLLADLRQYKGDQVSLAVVVYRDVGSPSGEVKLLNGQFTKDEKLLMAAISKIVPETGAPYFLELPDLGVHEALSKLNWAEGPDTTRWLLLFGDAPPYDPDFEDKEFNTGARRRFDTDLLIDLAKRKGVQISCVVCTSREEEKAVYDEVIDKTRKFMNSLATGTGGLMLDLSYPEIRATLVEAARKDRVERQRIGKITREDVDAVRKAAEVAKLPAAEGQKLRVAVLPHLPLDQMTFDPNHEAVQIAAELRQKFKVIPRAEVASPVDVDRALRRVKAAKVAPEQQLQALAAQLRADYLVWGSFRKAAGVVNVRSAIYRKSDGQKVTESQALTSSTLPENELASSLVNKWTLTAFDPKAAPNLHAVFAGLRNNPAANKQVLTPVANTVESRTDLLAGFEALEQSMSYKFGEAAGKTLLETAEQSLVRAETEDPRNPFIQLLLANCYFNQAQSLLANGDSEAAKEKGKQYSESLKRAYSKRDDAQVGLVQTEIEADFNLIVKKDFPAAIKLYETLATAPHDSTLHTALRAHWMLAGIYTGDWGASKEVVDLKKAREHLVLVLAHWPDSAEANFIKTQLRWSDERGGNQFEHFPQMNEVVLTQ